MALRVGSSSLSCVATSLSSPSQRRNHSKMSFAHGLHACKQAEEQLLRSPKGKSCKFACKTLKLEQWFSKKQYIHCAASEDQLSYVETEFDASGEENHKSDAEDISPSDFFVERAAGKPGLISFYDHGFRKEDKIFLSGSKRKRSNLLWFAGPIVLVASFIFPSLYLRKILSSIFEDSLLTDFLILFFTEALFYCGVAIFLLLIDRSRRHLEPLSPSYIDRSIPQLAYRISSVSTLALSLIIPMVTMGLVWPWTGPAASATLAPYLVGIVVQFSFERYAKYLKSPSLPVIPVIFQVYRLHQLNRAAQLVTALSFTVRGAEMTTNNLAINSSLSTLLNVLQLLGVICIWSLSSFLMRFCPSSPMTEL